MADRPEEPDWEELVEVVAAQLVGYIGSGVTVDPVLDDFDPDLSLEGIEELLEYYFLLSGTTPPPDASHRYELDISLEETNHITDSNGTPVGVRDFVSLLPDRSRGLHLEGNEESAVFRGAAPGRVDWGKTIKHRYASGELGNQTFVSRIQSPTLVSPRNRVLYELLTTVRRIYDRFDSHTEGRSDFQWFSPWLNEPDYDDSVNLRSIVETTLERRPFVHFQPEETQVSDGDIRQAATDRDAIYREAGALLETHRDLISGNMDEEQVKSFLGSQIFAPSRHGEPLSTLYELYWIFKLLDTFENPQRRLIPAIEHPDLVARWEESGYRYLLFNDWDGQFDGEQLIEIRVPDPEMIRTAEDEQDSEAGSTGGNSGPLDDLTMRFGAVGLNHSLMDSRQFGRDHDLLTPDIVLLQLDAMAEERTLKRAFIGEVKHSTDTEYIVDGFKRLLEYGAFVRVGPGLQIDREEDSDFLGDSSDVFDSPELKLGYFVGHSDVFPDNPHRGIDLFGFGDEVPNPFEE